MVDDITKLRLLLEENDLLWKHIKSTILQKKYNNACRNLLGNIDTDENYAVKKAVIAIVAAVEAGYEEEEYRSGIYYTGI